jgi:S-DNA-T family DNA segregation ATPase FtsK/SpoIIIE
MRITDSKDDLRNSSNGSLPPDTDGGIGWLILERALRYADDIGGVALIAAAILTILGISGWTHGGLIDPWATFLKRWFGLGSLLFPVAMVFGAWFLFNRRRGRPIEVRWSQIVALELTLFGLLAIFAYIDGLDLPRAESGCAGGIVGWGVAALLDSLIGGFLGVIVLLLLIGGAGMYALRGVLANYAVRLQRTAEQGASQITNYAEAELPRERSTPATTPQERTASLSQLPRAYRKRFKVQPAAEDRPSRPARRDERLPPLTILETGRGITVTEREINLSAGLIEKTLADFGIPVRVVDFKAGPTVTQFAVEPGYVETIGADGEMRRSKVRVSQISSLASDLALALSAPTLRVEAPVPGRAYVGIEVPNRSPAVVRLRGILESDEFNSARSPLTIALGRDVSGKAVIADLASMPHLLIAGTTGSGKSVCITALATTLAFENSPEDLRFVMIDPKMVEMLRFNGLPHLIGKVETELDRITGVLRWCVLEMDRRYRMLEEAKARDIDSYNQKIRRKRDAERLERIVVMIDELADLMMMAPDQTEQTLVRLAQMARAVGIHLVLATQRPSTDILTGLIKANFPARISFAVASGIDSRVILDGSGAETLLGRGDMLFLSPEAGSPLRLQGVFVSDREIEGLLAYWRDEVGEHYQGEKPPWDDLIARIAVVDERDEIIEKAIALVKEKREASASMLQRGLRIGYPRAARLMDELEELGVVGRPQSGGRTREVLISQDDDPLLDHFEDDDAA